MGKYIDKTEIDNILRKLWKEDKGYGYIDTARISYNKALQEVQCEIDTLEVKEVGLEKEMGKYLDANDIEFAHQIKLLDFAKHFFELGIQARIDKELVEEVYAHIDGIKNTADRMTSGNFMHHRASIKFSANTIAKVLELIGLKVQKGE